MCLPENNIKRNDKRYEIAYEACFSSEKHYSSLLYKSRLLIIAIILVIWSILLNINNLKISTKLSPLISYLGAIAVGIFTLMKIMYVKVFWRIIIIGKRLENNENIYFSEIKNPIIWPFIFFYFLNISVWLYLFLVGSNFNIIIKLILIVIPFFLIGLSVFELKKYYRETNISLDKNLPQKKMTKTPL